MLLTGTIGAILTGLLLAPALQSGSLVVIFVGLGIALLVMGFVYGPLGSWLPSLFPARVRYTGVSLAFNVLSIVVHQVVDDKTREAWVHDLRQAAYRASLLLSRSDSTGPRSEIRPALVDNY